MGHEILSSVREGNVCDSSRRYLVGAGGRESVCVSRVQLYVRHTGPALHLARPTTRHASLQYKPGHERSPDIAVWRQTTCYVSDARKMQFELKPDQPLRPI